MKKKSAGLTRRLKAKTLRAMKDVERKRGLRRHKNVEGLLRDLKK